jgi:hypothetical protein
MDTTYGDQCKVIFDLYIQVHQKSHNDMAVNLEAGQEEVKVETLLTRRINTLLFAEKSVTTSHAQ